MQLCVQGKPLSQVGRQLQRNRTLFRSPGLRQGANAGEDKVGCLLSLCVRAWMWACGTGLVALFLDMQASLL